MAISSSCWLCNLQGVFVLEQCPKKKKSKSKVLKGKSHQDWPEIATIG
jgi:hypothetical protein